MERSCNVGLNQRKNVFLLNAVRMALLMLYLHFFSSTKYHEEDYLDLQPMIPPPSDLRPTECNNMMSCILAYRPFCNYCVVVSLHGDSFKWDSNAMKRLYF